MCLVWKRLRPKFEMVGSTWDRTRSQRIPSRNQRLRSLAISNQPVPPPQKNKKKKKNPIWPFILASFQQQNETILRLFKNEKHISLINTHSRCEFEFSWETRNNVVDDAESSFVVYFLDGVVFGESETTSIVGVVVVVVGEGEGGFYSELGCEESASRQPH